MSHKDCDDKRCMDEEWLSRLFVTRTSGVSPETKWHMLSHNERVRMLKDLHAPSKGHSWNPNTLCRNHLFQLSQFLKLRQDLELGGFYDAFQTIAKLCEHQQGFQLAWGSEDTSKLFDKNDEEVNSHLRQIAKQSESSSVVSGGSGLYDQLVDPGGVLHGRSDPGNDGNFGHTEGFGWNTADTEMGNPQRESLLDVLGEDMEIKGVREGEEMQRVEEKPTPQSHNNTNNTLNILKLPPEVLGHIFDVSDPVTIENMSLTCKIFKRHARDELLWERKVQSNVPGLKLPSPYPCTTYRELYTRHDPNWFLPKHKIWFCDWLLTGKIIIARYDPRRGVIEGYRMVAERALPTYEAWEADEMIMIHSFKPHVKLHLDEPVLKLELAHLDRMMVGLEKKRFYAETPMPIDDRNHNGVFSNFLLAKPVPGLYESMQAWPPMTIPASHRVRSGQQVDNASQVSFVALGHKPRKREEVSNQAFRIRRWMEMTPAQDNRMGMRIHLGEQVYTYATLDPILYTPTKQKPYRGIWVGDYSGHGCEFLLIDQPDTEKKFDKKKVVQEAGETLEEWETRTKEEEKKCKELLYRGRLQAVKLTGDPNVPRGEYTFIADDILTNRGFIRTATEEPFRGARIVHSRGQIGDRMFQNHKYIATQLILISHDRLAQYWIDDEFGHISFYERVDIDRFLDPANDPPPPPPL